MAYQYISKKQYPISNMVVGDDWRELVPVVLQDRITEFDFGGWQAKAQVRGKLTGELLVEFNSESSSPTIEFDGGDMYLIQGKDDTIDFLVDDYVWDCEFTDTDGLVRTLIIESPFEIIGGQTV